jgi:hypothetical protein
MNPDWVAAIAALIGIGAAAFAAVRSSGSKETNHELRIKNLEARMQEHADAHENHYRHERDNEVHWTSRERNQLQDSIRDLGRKMDKILDRVLKPKEEDEEEG